MAKPWRWRFAFLAIACLLVLLLGFGGSRLIRQEQTLARERIRERLENAASLVVRESERAFARASGESSLALVWDQSGLRRASGVPLVWSASPSAPPEPPPGAFSSGETLEFAAGQAAR